MTARTACCTALLLTGLLAGAPGLAVAGAACVAQPELLQLGAPLPNSRAAIARRQALEIVALGSSSTEGYGTTSALDSYPAELLRALSIRLPGIKIGVSNRGVGGEDAAAMLERLERDVLSESPDLVIWQVGTNAALRALDLEGFRRLLGEGIDRLQARGADVILMTPQYAPAVVALPNEEDYVLTMTEVAREKRAGLFPRFRIMKDWFEVEQMPYARFITRDGLHLNDFGYRCVGQLLARAIEGELKR
jgi:lysophospholipase L1-like esterase